MGFGPGDPGSVSSQVAQKQVPLAKRKAGRRAAGQVLGALADGGFRAWLGSPGGQLSLESRFQRAFAGQSWNVQGRGGSFVPGPLLLSRSLTAQLSGLPEWFDDSLLLLFSH